MTKENSTTKIRWFPYVRYLLQWLPLSFLIGILIGSVTAFFLSALNFVTNWRESHLWIIYFLPVAGLLIGLAYHHFGKSVAGGNNLLLEEYYEASQTIPIKMAPMVLAGTLITHLFGGSAGREGTALQMGGAIADQFTKWFRLDANDRQIIIIVGISGGFAAVFGTPFAGAIFAMEVLALKHIQYNAILPSIVVAFIADYFCKTWGISHTHYAILNVPQLSAVTIIWTLFAGITFGLTALLFSKSMHFASRFFTRTILYAPLRPFIGGIIIVLAVWILGTTKYIGLGIPSILAAFETVSPAYDFLIKLALTVITLSCGFKGGEVTPLFFIGAVLGSAMFAFIPLPIALLAGTGFVAVFSGATNTPIASTIMGIELFGYESGIYIGIACFTAYLFSGNSAIYTSQQTPKWKEYIYAKLLK